MAKHSKARRRRAESRSHESDRDLASFGLAKGDQESVRRTSARDEAVTVLKQGVDAWNTWIAEKRKINAEFQPDLQEVDFREPEWRETPYWRKVWSRSQREVLCLFEGIPGSPGFRPIDLENTLLRRAHFEDVRLYGARLNDADLQDAHFDRAHLAAARLHRATLSNASLEHTWLRTTDFSNADVYGVNYKQYRGWPLDIFPFNQAFWPFKRHLMLEHYLGVQGLDSCHGNPAFRRDAQDQDFIDNRFERVRLIESWRIEDRDSRLFGWLLNSTWGKRVRLIAALPRRIRYGRIPGRLLFALWGFFDYGRSILSLLIFAIGLIVALGFWYQGLEASNAITFTGNLATLGSEDAFLRQLRPWFAALMGFATLGLTDMIEPNNRWGAFAMALNVIAGFSTLGLFIAVFQNIFARRS